MNIDKHNERLRETINCQHCVFYYVTWDKYFPRGCRLYGFKTSSQPSYMVIEATGGGCKNYRKKSNGAQPRPIRIEQ